MNRKYSVRGDEALSVFTLRSSYTDDSFTLWAALNFHKKLIEDWNVAIHHSPYFEGSGLNPKPGEKLS
jgi:hypothetical protein